MFSGVPAKFARAPSFFITSTGTTPRSNGPDVAILINSGVAANVMSSLWPVAFSNCGPISFRLAVIEPPAMTFSSAARAGASAIASPIAAAIANLSMLFLPLARSAPYAFFRRGRVDASFLPICFNSASWLFPLLQQLVAQLGQPFQLFVLLGDAVGVALFVPGA